MTAVAIAPTTRLRLTARGRRVITALAALPAVVAIVIAALSGGAALASLDGGAPTEAFAEITVMSGETLWSIAEDIASAADPRDVVAEISLLNALDGGAVAAGQRLSIPAEYSASE